MKIRKALAAVLCVAICLPAACFAGCNNDGMELILKYPKSLTISSLADPAMQSVKDFLEAAADEYERESGKNVTIRVTAFESGAETKAIAGTFGSENATDILYDNFFNMASFAHTGNAVPLDDVLPPETVGGISEQYLDYGKIEGKQYLLPFLARQNILIYNKELVTERIRTDCGIAIAESKTIETWEIGTWTALLNKLTEELPAGKYPMMMYAKDNQGDTHIMTMLRAFGSGLYDSENKFALKDDENAVRAIEWLQSGVKNGWYMANSFDKTMSDCSSKFKMGELAFYNFNLGSSVLPFVQKEGGEERYGFVNYPGGNCTYFCDGFEIFDNGNAKKIEAAKDFLRYLYGTERWIECSAGNLPVSHSVEQKYRDRIFMYDEFEKNKVNAVDFFKNLPNWQGSANSVRSVFYKEIARLLQVKANGEFLLTGEVFAAELEEKLNAALEHGWQNSRLHE